MQWGSTRAAKSSPRAACCPTATLGAWPSMHAGVDAASARACLRRWFNAAVQRGMEQVMLNAQVQALAFYRRHGFIEEGETFMEAGIPHRAMRLRCSAQGEGGA